MRHEERPSCIFECLLALAVIFSMSAAMGQEEKEEKPASPGGGVQTVLAETHMDRPGEFHEVFGMPLESRLRDSLKRLSKIDMDGDLNYDGSIDNADSGDQGFFENRPPGLQLGTGELTKLVVRFKTYESSFPGEIYVKLEAAGINRFAANGNYGSEKEEKESVGRIRVWESPRKKTLLVDSGDPEKRSIEWKVDKEKLVTGVPGTVPRILYVEGVGKSKKFEGDLRLLISASHSLGEGESRPPSGSYHTAFDHILFTVREKAVEKAFINNNVEGVWPGAGAGAGDSTGAGGDGSQ